MTDHVCPRLARSVMSAPHLSVASQLVARDELRRAAWNILALADREGDDG